MAACSREINRSTGWPAAQAVWDSINLHLLTRSIQRDYKYHLYLFDSLLACLPAKPSAVGLAAVYMYGDTQKLIISLAATTTTLPHLCLYSRLSKESFGLQFKNKQPPKAQRTFLNPLDLLLCPRVRSWQRESSSNSNVTQFVSDPSSSGS